VGAWPAFTNQQVADAKARACAPYTTVRTGVSLQTHATGAADPVATPAVAVDARLSEVASAQYLLNRLDPATPPPLAAAIHTFADDLLDIAANALAGAPNDDPAQAGRLRDGGTASAHSGSVQMSPRSACTAELISRPALRRRAAAGRPARMFRHRMCNVNLDDLR
jgi:hypothetical protein